jgi:hypothetical protein
MRWATSLPRAWAAPGKTVGYALLCHWANTVETGCVSTVAVGCALLCHWAAADSARWLLNYFSIF